MTIANNSFEIAGARKGTASLWTLAENSQLVDVAEFGDLCGYERFEKLWRLSLGINIQGGSTVSSHQWATILSGAPTIGTAPDSDFVTAVAAIVVIGTIPAGPDVTVTLGYTNELSVAGRTATAVVPAEEVGGHEYYFALEGDDKGFESIQTLTTSISVTATIAIVGSWLKLPLNEDSQTVYLLADLEIGQFTGNDFDAFEAGWTNDSGKLDNLDALLTALALFDSGSPENFEDFEEEWRLPQIAGPFTNELVSFGHEQFLDSSIQDAGDDAFVITLDVNDIVSIRWTANGTLADQNVQLVPGSYSALANKILCIPGVDLIDGKTVVIDDGVNPIVTFEFDDDSSVSETATLRQVVFAVTDTANDIRDAISDAINNAPTLDASATTLANGVARVQHTTAGNPLVITETVADVDFVAQPTIVQELTTRIGIALDADAGLITSAHFLSSFTPDNKIRLENLEALGSVPKMELLIPPSNTAWSTLGFIPGVTTQRSREIDNLSVAIFDVGTPENLEDFEEEWRDNEMSITVFSGGDLVAALFDVGSPEAFENFEEEWVLTLP